MRTSKVSTEASEEQVRNAVTTALTAQGPHVQLTQSTAAGLSFRVGSIIKTSLFGGLVSSEKWPVEISLGLHTTVAGTEVLITVSGASSMMAGLAGMAMNKAGKAEQLWLDRTVQAVQLAASVRAVPPFTAAALTDTHVAAQPKVGAGPLAASGGSRKCATCGAALPPGTRFCVDCGAPAQAPPSACPSCGTAAVGAGKFCSNCGATLQVEKPKKKPAKKRPARSTVQKKKGSSSEPAGTAKAEAPTA